MIGLQLAHYRRTVAEHYATVRANPDSADAARECRAARDHLFKTHPLSALEPDQREAFTGLPYAPYDPAWRFVVPVETEDIEPEVFSAELPEGLFRYQRCGQVRFGAGGVLSLFWILGYGGGLFLPFGDTTNGQTTYGGGRYLYDTIKGADLGAGPESIVLDFNFAYHPSCYYSPRWTCPLTPSENRLPFAVPVGELSNRE